MKRHWVFSSESSAAVTSALYLSYPSKTWRLSYFRVLAGVPPYRPDLVVPVSLSKFRNFFFNSLLYHEDKLTGTYKHCADGNLSLAETVLAY